MSVNRAEAAAVQSYAAALFGVGQAKGALHQILEEARALDGQLKATPQFQSFLESPRIPVERKQALIERVYKDKLHVALWNLLRMLVDRGRAFILPDILAEFEAVAERAEGIHAGWVATAGALKPEQQKSLAGALEKAAHCKLKLEFRVHPELLGGVVFRYKDVLVDGSVRHGLDQIKKRFEGGEASAA